MIPTDGDDATPDTRLSTADIANIRHAWAMGVPLAIVARQYELAESDLRRHLGLPADVPIGPTHIQQMRERRRQIAALRQMIAESEGRSDA